MPPEVAFPTTAALAAAVLIALQVALMLSVGMHRFAVKVGVGNGEDRDLERKIRRHGNLSENAAIFVIVIALIEMAGGGGTVLMALAGAFVLARLSHAIAFSSQSGSHAPSGSVVFPMLRATGAFGTALTGFGLAALLLISVF